MSKRDLEILKGTRIVKWMDIAGDDLGKGSHPGPSGGIGRQEGGFRTHLVQIFTDREALGEDMLLAAWAEGCALPLAKAMALALGEVADG